MIIKNILINDNIPTFIENKIKIDDEIYCKTLRYGGNDYMDIYICRYYPNISKKICSLNIVFDTPMVKYKDGKLLIYTGFYNREINDYEVTSVCKLYNLVDDVFYSLKEVDALKVFDPFMSKKYLRNPNKYICVNNNEIKEHDFKPKLKVLSKKN